MTNTNCLENIQCPKCGNEDSFRIAAKTIATVCDDGVEDHTEMEWDDDSYADCTKCCHHGALKDFTVRSDLGADEGGIAMTITVKHRPGPWLAHGDRDSDTQEIHIVQESTGGEIAVIYPTFGQAGVDIANAILITAAPAQALMLDLVRYGLLSLADGDAEFNGTVYAFDHMQPDWGALIDAIGWDTARDAIAKATSSCPPSATSRRLSIIDIVPRLYAIRDDLFWQEDTCGIDITAKAELDALITDVTQSTRTLPITDDTLSADHHAATKVTEISLPSDAGNTPMIIRSGETAAARKVVVPPGTSLIAGRLYLHLYHGRNDPSEEMDDWGFRGPSFGPLTSVVQTYLTHFRLYGDEGIELWLETRDDMIVWQGSYYGDMSVFIARPDHHG
jgi:hypothetical protein